jgi:hypothetical protein
MFIVFVLPLSESAILQFVRVRRPLLSPASGRIAIQPSLSCEEHLLLLTLQPSAEARVCLVVVPDSCSPRYGVLVSAARACIRVSKKGVV